ncbi:hypothetical protein C8T65DRAFT_825009 [Cerioporus squamosus]|nr:hypothetical protein C8T65DRAFT_825009 [Cerioporus squamosus]
MHAPPLAAFLSHLFGAPRNDCSSTMISPEDMRDRIAQLTTCKLECVDDGIPVKAMDYTQCPGDPNSPGPFHVPALIFEESPEDLFTDRIYMARLWEARAHVYGCVYTGRRWLFELLASTSSNPVPTGGGQHLEVSPAALVDALIAGVNSLRTWYLQGQSDDFDGRDEFFPSPSRFTTHDGTPVTLSYLREYGSEGRSYMAVCAIAGVQRFVLVKLPSSAPGPGAVKMVVSTFNGAGSHVSTCQEAAGAREKVQYAVDVLHKRGFVHGDVRWRNVLLAEDGSVSLLRFDWAGRVGEPRYPQSLSSGVPWPKGATPGALITAELDQEWLDRMWAVDSGCLDNNGEE